MKPNKFKKVFITGIIAVVMLCPTFAFATTGEATIADKNQDSATVEVSEMDIINQLQDMSKDELKAKGFTTEEINELRSVNYKSVIQEARECSDDELKARGLTASEINTVRNGAITPLTATVAAGKVSYTIKKVSYSYDSGNKKTNLTTKLTWKWSKAPAYKFTDIVALTTSNSNFLAKSTSGSVNYRSSSAAEVRKSSDLTGKTTGASTGTFARFETQYVINPRGVKYFAFDGNIKTSWQASGKVSSVGIAGNYGHTIVSLTPSVSVSTSGPSISFSPAASVNQGDEASIVVNL